MNGHIKICGLRISEMAEIAIEAGADLIGLVFFEKSPRHVTLTEATEVVKAVRGKVGIVGLMADPDDDLLTEVTQNVPLTHLQLHGKEPLKRVSFIRTQYKLPILKAIGVSSRADIEKAETYNEVADMILFDAKPPADAVHPGGLGKKFDWSVLGAVSGKASWMLSGGLTVANVGEAIRTVSHLPGFSGVDVSSGVETARGIKDANLIRDFVWAAQAAMASKEKQE